MDSVMRQKPPMWYWVAAIVLLLWGAMGIWSFYEHVAHGPAAMGNVPTQYDVQLYASLPGWYVWVYGVAVWAGLAAAAALLMRHWTAVALAAISLVAIVVMFGWFFATTDIIAAKGLWTTYFPAAIFLLGLFQLWLARTARARGWIG